MTAIDMIHSITPDQLTERLQAAGYRVNRTEQGGVVQLLSASQGIGFAVRFGNPATDAGAYLDYCFSCALRIQGELPAGLAECGTPAAASPAFRARASSSCWRWTPSSPPA